MKISVKSVFGVMLSIAWLVVYVGCGAILLEHQVIKNPDRVPVYIPLVVFLWVAGFFVGHAAIEKIFLIFLQSKNPHLASSHVSHALDTDNLPIPNKTINKKYPANFFNNPLRQNNNPKKDTGKFIKVFKSSACAYKIARHC
jgi:hypothetical protein